MNVSTLKQGWHSEKWQNVTNHGANVVANKHTSIIFGYANCEWGNPMHLTGNWKQWPHHMKHLHHPSPQRWRIWPLTVVLYLVELGHKHGCWITQPLVMFWTPHGSSLHHWLWCQLGSAPTTQRATITRPRTMGSSPDTSSKKGSSSWNWAAVVFHGC